MGTTNEETQTMERKAQPYHQNCSSEEGGLQRPWNSHGKNVHIGCMGGDEKIFPLSCGEDAKDDSQTQIASIMCSICQREMSETFFASKNVFRPVLQWSPIVGGGWGCRLLKSS